MLPAKLKMSNMFLHFSQNIDTAANKKPSQAIIVVEAERN
jgi:hypothetical protein